MVLQSRTTAPRGVLFPSLSRAVWYTSGAKERIWFRLRFIWYVSCGVLRGIVRDDPVIQFLPSQRPLPKQSSSVLPRTSVFVYSVFREIFFCDIRSSFGMNSHPQCFLSPMTSFTKRNLRDEEYSVVGSGLAVLLAFFFLPLAFGLERPYKRHQESR